MNKNTLILYNMAKNKNAGNHPSYDKRNMSEEARKNKQAYDKKFAASEEQKKKRAECNKARRNAKSNGKDIDGKDASHTKNGIVFKKTSVNRGSKKDSQGDKNARG